MAFPQAATPNSATQSRFAKLAAMKRALSKRPKDNPAEEAAEYPQQEAAEGEQPGF